MLKKVKIFENYFLIIGAQRSGTTYLYNILDEHPEICLAKPVKPEPKYFLGAEFNGNPADYRNAFFDRNKNYKSYGEKGTTYYENSWVTPRVLEFFPDAKFLIILRNPVERAVSNYYFSKNNNLETRTLEEVFLEEKQQPPYPNYISTNPFDYLQRGIYLNYIQSFLNYIPADKLKILIFEELVENLSEIQALYKYLNVSSDFVPDSLHRQINASSQTILPKKIQEKLHEYFIPYNKQLSDFLGRAVFKQKQL